jgi:CBS domain-containing protein
MKARDVMVSPVITVTPNSSVGALAQTLLKNRISGVPVVDWQGQLVGIVSEGDLLHRSETGTEPRRSRRLRPIMGIADERLAAEYIKAHSRKVADIMVRDVLTADPETPLEEIAILMEQNSIKRVPILSKGQLVGIVSRANLIQAVASNKVGLELNEMDTAIRDRLLAHLKAQQWAHAAALNVTANGGVVHLWGVASSEIEREAIRVAAETTPGVHAVYDHMVTGSYFGQVEAIASATVQ